MTLKDKDKSGRLGPLKSGVDIFINRPKVIILLAFWSILLALVGYIFLFQYPGSTALVGNDQVPMFLQAYSDEIFMAFGAALAIMIGFYIIILLSHFVFRGPIYRIDDKGLHFMQAENFTIPPNAIHAVSFSHNSGLATTLVIEIWEKDRLLALANRMRKFSGATVHIKDRSVLISLTEVKGRTRFIAALDALSDRVRY